MVFMAKATALGFTVCKPYGDNRPFDFLLNTSGRTSCVQVKSGWVEAHGAYQIRTSRLVRKRRKARGRRTTRAYRADEIDFIVALIVPENAWYVIPLNAVRRTCGIALYPHVTRSRGKYEQFREAWHLLAAPAALDKPAARKKLAQPSAKAQRPAAASHAHDRKARVAWEALGEWLFGV